MSIKLMSLAWELEDLSHGEKLVLLAFADHANDEGVCYPSIARIAKKTNYTRRAVQRIVRRLDEKNYLIVIDHAPGRPGIANTYLVTPVREVDEETGDEITPLSPRRASSATKRGVISSATGDRKDATGGRGDALTVIEPSVESSKNQNRVLRSKIKNQTCPKCSGDLDEGNGSFRFCLSCDEAVKAS